MSRLSYFVLALGLVAVLPTVAAADAPSARRSGMVDTERAELRPAVLLLRAIVEQTKSPRFCGPLAELQATERALKQLEWAYAQNMPSPVKMAKPGR